MNKTLYLPDEDGPLWDRARELAGNKLSPIVIEALKAYVSKMDAEPKGFERIVLEYSDSDNHYVPTAKAFYGRWICPVIKPFSYITYDERNMEIDENFFAIAQTSKGRIVIFSWKVDKKDGSTFGQRFNVFPSLEEAAAQRTFNRAARHAIEKQGVPVQELDI